MPVWVDTLDSLTVVTAPDDVDTLDACAGHGRVRVVTTDLFYRHGASFNKGAALCVAYAAMDPIDGVLHFDADIVPDPNWRAVAEREFLPGAIHGARRFHEDGRPIEDLGPWPYGYFQLWHADDPAVQFWPLFEPWHPHAGSYDLEFLEKWPSTSWRGMNFKVTHFGEVRRNWFGVGLPEDQQAESFRKMDQVHKVGLRRTRVEARDQRRRLKVPDFKLKLCFDGRQRQWAREMIRACMTDDPFLVSAYVGKPAKGHVSVAPNTPPETVRKRVQQYR